MARYFYPSKWQSLFNQRQLTTGRAPTSEEIYELRRSEIEEEQQGARFGEQLGEQKRQFDIGQAQSAYQFETQKKLQEQQMAGQERAAKIGAIGQIAGFGVQAYGISKMFPAAKEVLSTTTLGGSTFPTSTMTGASTAVDVGAGGAAQPAVAGVSGLGPAFLGAGAGFVGGEIGKRVFLKSPREGGAVGGALMGGSAGGPVGAIIGGIVGAISGNSNTVICTELHRQGYISDEVYKYDSLYFVPEVVYSGYLKMAAPVVQKMKKSRFVTRLVAILGVPVSKEMAHRCNPKIKSNFIGKLVLKVGFRICRLAFYGGKKWLNMALIRG